MSFTKNNTRVDWNTTNDANIIATKPLDIEVLHELFLWLDTIPLSRPKREIHADFSDGVLFAEIIHYFFPSAVDLHNFSGCSSYKNRKTNWDTLKAKVFRKIGLRLSDQLIRHVCQAKSDAIEKALYKVYKIVKNEELGRENKIGGRALESSGDTASINNSLQENIRKIGDVKISKKSNDLTLERELASKNKAIENLTSTVTELESKLKRYEVLILLKDAKLNELSHTLLQMAESRETSDPTN